MPKRTNDPVEQLLRDCLAADPSLKGREDDVRAIITTLLAAKPDTRFDAAFAARLKTQLMEKETMQTTKPATRRSPWLLIGLPVGAFAALLLALVVTQPRTGAPSTGDIAATPAGGVQVTKVAAAAFGSLSGTGDGKPESARSMAVGMGGGGGGTAAAVPAPTDDAKMIAPGEPSPASVVYQYDFDASQLDLPESVDVYRRVKALTVPDITSALRGATGGLVNLSGLQSVRAGAFSLVEDRDFGYVVGIDPTEGTVNFSQNWLKWPHPESQCRDEACFQAYRLNPSDVPADDALIAVADAFLSNYGISRDTLGAPEVNNLWRQPYDLATPEARSSLVIYTPDAISITYPQVIDGLTVVDDSGMPSGITVNVNVRYMKVDGAWNISSTAFEQSSYAAGDRDTVAKTIAQGGVWFWPVEGATVEHVGLGSPERVLRRTWKARDDGTSDDLLVPALRFPIANPPVGQEWRRYVVVPLAKDALEQGNIGVPIPFTTPAVEPAVSDAPAASTGAAAAPALQ